MWRMITRQGNICERYFNIRFRKAYLKLKCYMQRGLQRTVNFSQVYNFKIEHSCLFPVYFREFPIVTVELSVRVKHMQVNYQQFQAVPHCLLHCVREQ